VLGHNGNLVNTHELKRHATELGIRGYAEDRAHSDSDIMATLLAHEALDGGLEEAAARLLPRLRGAYCITFSDEQTLYAARERRDGRVQEAPARLRPRRRGPSCITFADGETLHAARDPHGVRPLALGRLDRGRVVASEPSPLDIVGASFVRDIEPGELGAID